MPCCWGYAAVYHAQPRFTKDFDLFIWAPGRTELLKGEFRSSQCHKVGNWTGLLGYSLPDGQDAIGFDLSILCMDVIVQQHYACAP